MKRRLVLGLGNALAGDDGIGLRVAERLRDHPNLQADIDVELAGTDLLRFHDAMRGRSEVILLDALLGQEAPGTVEAFDLLDGQLSERGASVHQLPPTAALSLLRAVDPMMRPVRFTLVCITISGARVGDSLSANLTRRLDSITERVRREIDPTPTVPRTRQPPAPPAVRRPHMAAG